MWNLGHAAAIRLLCIIICILKDVGQTIMKSNNVHYFVFHREYFQGYTTLIDRVPNHDSIAIALPIDQPDFGRSSNKNTSTNNRNHQSSNNSGNNHGNGSLNNNHKHNSQHTGPGIININNNDPSLGVNNETLLNNNIGK